MISDQPTAAPPHFPYREHRTMREIMDEECLEHLCDGHPTEVAAALSGVSIDDARDLQKLLEETQ